MPQKYTNQAQFFRFLSPIHVVIMSLFVDFYERSGISLSSLQSVMFRTCAGFSELKNDAAFLDLLKFTITNYCSLMLDQEASISSSCKDRFMSGIDLTTFSATESERGAGARLAARLAKALGEKNKKRSAAAATAAAATASSPASKKAKGKEGSATDAAAAPAAWFPVPRRRRRPLRRAGAWIPRPAACAGLRPLRICSGNFHWFRPVSRSLKRC